MSQNMRVIPTNVIITDFENVEVVGLGTLPSAAFPESF